MLIGGGARGIQLDEADQQTRRDWMCFVGNGCDDLHRNDSRLATVRTVLFALTYPPSTAATTTNRPEVFGVGE